MGLQRALAFVLSLTLFTGSVMPAYAADSMVVNTISDNVVLTSDENEIQAVEEEVLILEEEEPQELEEGQEVQMTEEEEPQESEEEEGESKESKEEEGVQLPEEESKTSKEEESQASEEGQENLNPEETLEEETPSEEMTEELLGEEDMVPVSDTPELTFTEENLMAQGSGSQKIKVMYVEKYVDENEDGIPEPVGVEQSYAALEDAIAGIKVDFQEAKGEYCFWFLQDVTMETDVTIPACVTDLRLLTEDYDDGDGAILRELDFQGHILNTTAAVTLESGLCIVSNAKKTVTEHGETKEIPIAGTLNLQKDMNIRQLGELVYENGEKPGRSPALLKHIQVNAPKAAVQFLAEEKEPIQDMGSTVITAKKVEVLNGTWQCQEVDAEEFELKRGSWNANTITAGSLYVGSGYFKDGDDALEAVFEKASLTAGDITIHQDGKMQVAGIVGSEGWDADSPRPDVTLNGGRLYIEKGENFQKGGECYLGVLTVKTAYGSESMEDYTVENEGKFFVKTLEMKVGTLQNKETMLVKEINNIKDFYNEGSLICDTFYQISAGKTYLSGGSRFLINREGKLYNVNLGGKNGEEGNPVLGLLGYRVWEESGSRVEMAKVALNGSFNRNGEDQKLEIAVTDSYKDIEGLSGDMIYFNPYTYQPETAGTKITLVTLTAGEVLFTTDHKEFPAESILLHPVYELDAQGNPIEEDGKYIENRYASALHYMDTTEKKNEVRVAAEGITLYSINTKGEEVKLKGFTDWEEAVKYLGSVGNGNTGYKLCVDYPLVDVKGGLQLPANVAGLEICGMGKEATEFLFTGRLDLPIPVSFTNVKFPRETVIDTKGKKLVLSQVNGNLGSIAGTDASVVCIKDSELSIGKDITTIGSLELVNTRLDVAKNITVTKLSLANMEKPSCLTASEKITITDLEVIGQGNGLRYGRSLEIKGNLSSISAETTQQGGFCIDLDDVYADPIKERETDGEGEIVTITGYTIRDSYEELEDKTDYKMVKKNAVSLEYTGGAVTEGTPLVTASKIASHWFVYQHSREENNPPAQIKNVTYKEGNTIKYGLKGSPSDAVILEYEMPEGGQKHRIDCYSSMQDAFREIERIGDKSRSYHIILKKDVEELDKQKKNIDYQFPEKAAKITISGEAGSKKVISFQNRAELKCDVDFKNVILKACGSTASLVLKEYKIFMQQSELSPNIAVSGSGVTKASSLVIASDSDESFVRMASLKGIGSFTVRKTQVYVEGDLETGQLSLEDALLAGEAAMKIADVAWIGKAALVTFPKVTASGITPNLQISGEVAAASQPMEEGSLESLKIQLGKSLDFVTEESGELRCRLEIYDGSEFSKDWIKGNKVILAKAPKVATRNIEFVQKTSVGGYLYKKAGTIVYKDKAPAAELRYDTRSYDDLGQPVEIVTECESFADAAAEINSLKTKRDYTICFLPNDASAPSVLTMPAGSNVKSLTLTSKTDEVNQVPYLKELSFTFPVILKDISFVQMTEVKDDQGKVIPGSYEVITSRTSYPAPVSVKTTGEKLTFEGEVSFNTPILLNGGNKAELIFGEGVLVTADSQGAATDSSYIQGKITGFKNVNISQSLWVDNWKTSKKEYGSCAVDVTALTLGETGELLAGSDVSGENLLKVKDLFLDGGEVKVYGNAELTNVTLSGTKPWIEAAGAKFNITGLLTSSASGGRLVTAVDSINQKPALNISGKAVLQNEVENKIEVQLMDEEGNCVKVPGMEMDEQGKESYFPKTLLKAKNINANLFQVSLECLPEGIEGEYRPKSGSAGYFLKKNGEYIEAYPGNEAQAALYRKGENEPVNCYTVLNEALSQIKAYNHGTEEYIIVLLKDVGTQDSPYKMTVPEKAAKITFTVPEDGKEKIGVYLKTAMVQKTDLAFQNITLVNDSTWDAKKFVLEMDSSNVTVKGKTVAENLVLADGAVFRIENTAVITNITNSNTKDGGNNQIICSKESGLTIKGYVTDKDENGVEVAKEDSFPKVILNADGTATRIEASKTDIKKNNAVVGVKYDLGKTKKIAVLEKETMDNFLFRNGTTQEVNVVWASKGIYLAGDDYDYGAEVREVEIPLGASVENGESGSYEVISSTLCLDLAEASNYINTVSDKSKSYCVLLPEETKDTKITDTSERSTFILPAKDKAKLVVVQPKDSIESAVITFTGDLKASGKVWLNGVTLDNNKEFSIAMEKNSDIRNGKQVIAGESHLSLRKVKAEKLKNITGVKGTSNLRLVDCHTDFAEGMKLTGGITNVVNLELAKSRITTNAKSDVGGLKITSFASWDAFAPAVIGSVALELDDSCVEHKTYLGTFYPAGKGLAASGIPQVTIKNEVTGGVLPVKIYDVTDGYNTTETAVYEDSKLVLAVTQSADKFIASGFAKYSSQEGKYVFDGQYASYDSYKDKNGYVYNGSVQDKKILLSRQKESGAWDESYVSNYAEAIEIINYGGNKDAVYKITLCGNDTTVFTASDSQGKVKVGTWGLPKAGKAKTLMILGNGPDCNGTPIEKRTIEYTGALQPNCDLILENVELHEVNNTLTVDGITVKTGNYNVTFGENTTVRTSSNFKEDAQLVLKTMDGNKGGVTVSDTDVYVSSNIRLEKLEVSGDTQVYVNGDIQLKNLRVQGDTDLICKGKTAITEIAYENEIAESPIVLSITGEKEIVLTDVGMEGVGCDFNQLDITTYYKDKAFTSSETQLTVNGEVDSSIQIAIKLWIYQPDSNAYEALSLEEAKMLYLIADTKPKAFQKIVKAVKMKASEEVKILYKNSLGEWMDEGINIVKYDGGIYVTKEESGIEVIGFAVKKEAEAAGDVQTEEMVEMYRAVFLDWEQAVKEIDKLGHKDWVYHIRLLKDQGSVLPLKSVNMPLKAEKIVVDGEGHAGILTTATKISIKCETEWRNLSISAVKKSGKKYYSIPFVLDCGKFKITLNDMKRSKSYDNMGWLGSSLKISGTKDGIVEVKVKDTNYSSLISQISNVGTVILYHSMYGEVPGRCSYEVKEGIKGVQQLQLLAGAWVNAVKSEISVTNLTIGEATGVMASEATGVMASEATGVMASEAAGVMASEAAGVMVSEAAGVMAGEGAKQKQVPNELRSKLTAKNINVSGTASMASADLKAGTAKEGDGKITLGNVMLRDGHVMLEGKQNKKGSSLIQIKGVVSYTEDALESLDTPGICISLCFNNSTKRKVMLVNGLTLLTAPKAQASMFIPNYDWIDDKGTPEQQDDVYHQNMGCYVESLGLYKDKNDIKYGRVP